MVSKLIVFPLVLMFFLTFLGFLVNGSTPEGGGIGNLRVSVDGNYEGTNTSYVKWYDAGGHALLYANGSAVGERGVLELKSSGGVNVRLWFNSSSTYVGYVDWENFGGSGVLGGYLASTGFPVYLSSGGSDAGVVYEGWSWNQGFDAWGSIGLLAIIWAIMGLATIVGAHILGSGVSDVSVNTIVKGAAWTGIFTMASVGALPLLLQIPVFGWLSFFTMSCMFTLGAVGTLGFGHDSGG